MAEEFSKMQCISKIGGSHWEGMLRADVGEKTVHLD